MGVGFVKAPFFIIALFIVVLAASALVYLASYDVEVPREQVKVPVDRSYFLQ